MASESARANTGGQPAETSSGSSPPQNSESQSQLGGFWYWFPVAIAAAGGMMIATLLALAAYLAEAESGWYAATFAITAFLALVAPPLIVWKVIKWIDKELRKATAEDQGGN